MSFPVTSQVSFQHIFHWLVLLLSLALFYGFNLVFALVCKACTHPANPYMVAIQAFRTPEHWLAVFLVIVIALTPR